MSLDQAKHVFSELNRIVLNTESTLNDEGMARLILKEDWMPNVNFCYVENLDSMLVFAECGPIEESLEKDLLKDLLRRQFMFDLTNGIEYSIAPDNNFLVVQRMLPIPLLDGNKLLDILVEFVQEVARLRLVLLRRSDTNDSASQAPDSAIENFGNFSNFMA